MTQVIVNLGTGGSNLNGQNGSTTSADSNDARFLDWPGDNAGNYVYLPGVASNYLSVPDEAALDITGDIDIRVRVAMDDWTAENYLAAKFPGGTNRSWQFRLNTDGTLRAIWSTDGTSTTLRSSTVSVSASDGDVLWVRFTLDVDNGVSGTDLRFYTSDDGLTWSQLGSTVTVSGTTSIYSGNAVVEIGAANSGTVVGAGKFYRAQVLDGIDGTPVLDVDCSQITSGSATSFAALTGQTVTINRSTSGRKSVAVVSPVWLFGTDDYMEVSDNALLDFGASDDFTLLAVVRQWNTSPNFGAYATKYEAASGYRLSARQTSLRPQVTVSDDVTSVIKFPSTTITAGSLQVYGAVVDRVAQTVAPIMDGAVDATADISSVGALSNALPFLIGRRSGATAEYQDFELLGVAVFRRVLTQSEITQITSYYQARLS